MHIFSDFAGNMHNRVHIFVGNTSYMHNDIAKTEKAGKETEKSSFSSFKCTYFKDFFKIYAERCAYFGGFLQIYAFPLTMTAPCSVAPVVTSCKLPALKFLSLCRGRHDKLSVSCPWLF